MYTIFIFQTYHAAVEYASPVRTLYIMRNTTHRPENPASQSLTDGWLQGEIKLLHTELTKLIADAKPDVNENIDLVYLEDGEWSNLSKYTLKRVSILHQQHFDCCVVLNAECITDIS